jgi:hypothetical protein
MVDLALRIDLVTLRSATPARRSSGAVVVAVRALRGAVVAQLPSDLSVVDAAAQAADLHNSNWIAVRAVIATKSCYPAQQVL